MFNERKVAQMAAFLLGKNGGRMSHLKLMKLLYLADREAMARYGSPISGDRMVSMPRNWARKATTPLNRASQNDQKWHLILSADYAATQWSGRWIGPGQNKRSIVQIT